MRAIHDSARHILVVDDDESVREALSTGLAFTYVVYTAARGDEACRILRRHPIAGIILDIKLRDENGLDLIERFRALANAPIVILTGHSTEDLAIRAVQSHVDDYLKKPASLPALHAALQRLLLPGGERADLAACARRYLDEHPAEPFRAATLAGQLGVSHMHLRRCFRAAYGRTPNQYLTEIRIQRAATLLQTNGLGVERIALEVGFPNVSWFNKLFKRAFGVTPLAYRAAGTPPEGVGRSRGASASATRVPDDQNGQGFDQNG